MTMTWEQKYDALASLSPYDAYVTKDISGTWYFHVGAAEIGDGHFLAGFAEHRKTVEDAVSSTWDRMIEECESGKVVVLHAMTPDKRRTVRWNGFMWQDVPKPSQAQAACEGCDGSGFYEARQGGDGYATVDVRGYCPECNPNGSRVRTEP